MVLMEIFLQNSNGMMLFGRIREDVAILIFAIFLIAVTVGIRWFLNKHDNKTNGEVNKKEVLR